MLVIQDLKFTKFFDVKSPVGVSQRGETLANYSIGVDLYMPELTEAFLEALVKANEKTYGNFRIQIEQVENEVTWYNVIGNKSDKTNQQLALFVKETDGSVSYQIHEPITIPTGIGILMPASIWAEVRTKSSNHQFGWFEIHGTIDMNYTYGIGVQIIPNNTQLLVELTPGQKFAQIVLHEAVPIMEMTELSQEEWNKNEEVITKREKRTGGFNSTGKF